jgi:hypothetical protein
VGSVRRSLAGLDGLALAGVSVWLKRPGRGGFPGW